MSRALVKVIASVVALTSTISSASEFNIGPCHFQYLEPCSSDTIQYYLFTSDNPEGAPVLLDNIDPHVPEGVNLTYQNKMIVHGYAGNIDFNATKLIRNGWWIFL